MLEVLVETGFLLALNPRDVHHQWALSLLEESRGKAKVLYISPASPVELSLILKSKGYSDESISRLLNAMFSIVGRYTRPRYPPMGLEHMAYAAELRAKYPQLTFFDSLHASVAILENLVYYDLDETVKGVIDSELKGKNRQSIHRKYYQSSKA